LRIAEIEPYFDMSFTGSSESRMKVYCEFMVIFNFQSLLLKVDMAKILREALGGSMESATVRGLEPPSSLPTTRSALFTGLNLVATCMPTLNLGLSEVANDSLIGRQWVEARCGDEDEKVLSGNDEPRFLLHVQGRRLGLARRDGHLPVEALHQRGEEGLHGLHCRYHPC
jgi:hypothetical protein